MATLSDRSRNRAAASPCTNTIGPNTRIEVRVPAISGPVSSLVARSAAARSGSPSALRRPVASDTTMALSTMSPTPSASPPSDRMLMVTPATWRMVSAVSTASGMTSPIARDARQSRRKSQIMSSASAPPTMISWPRLLSASVTNCAWAATTRIRTPGNSSPSCSMAR